MAARVAMAACVVDNLVRAAAASAAAATAAAASAAVGMEVAMGSAAEGMEAVEMAVAAMTEAAMVVASTFRKAEFCRAVRENTLHSSRRTPCCWDARHKGIRILPHSRHP